MLFPTQVNIAPTTQHIKRQGSKNNKSDNKLPHIRLQIKQIKKAPAVRTGAFFQITGLAFNKSSKPIYRP